VRIIDTILLDRAAFSKHSCCTLLPMTYNQRALERNESSPRAPRAGLEMTTPLVAMPAVGRSASWENWESQNMRRTIDLGGADWRFGCVSPKPLDSRLDDQAEVDEWLPATVPGNVRSDLLALGRMEDPFYGTNNEDSQWVDAFDWWYTRPLQVRLREGERAFLIFDGIDYISAVYLDQIELGRHEGMFSRQVYEITGLTKAEGSEVAVRI